MTEPNQPQPNPQPAPKPRPAANKNYVVASPWTHDVIFGNDEFPDITPAGVVMNESELEAAKRAASGLYLRLNVQEAE